MTTVARLFEQLTPDPWRTDVGFSAEIEAAHSVLFDPSVTESNAVSVLESWLQKYQPCVFGKMAAKFGFISFCLLTEADLMLPDEIIYEKIQRARLQWIKDGFEGKKSNFIILAISPRISFATPDPVVASLAQKLCSLYLEKDVSFDVIHHEQIFLEKPGSARMTWKWLAGVNYFSAHGDKRWWQDHRIPGGLGFSINSVGHLVKSEKVARAMMALNQTLAIQDEEGWNDSKVDSLEKALVLAMQTISQASDAISDPATHLLPLHQGSTKESMPECPIDLPISLSDKNYCSYVGYYHTDYTLPNEYFIPDVSRPESIESFLLDFTYLFHKHIDNPDHWTMSEGTRIRADEDIYDGTEVNDDTQDYKQFKGRAKTASIENCELLVKALAS